MLEVLTSFKGREFVGVKELADAAEMALRQLGSNPEKETAAAYPNERTVRFYNTEGLLPPPVATKGSASVYGYLHLLVLITIKKLQSDGLPIAVIRTLISGKSAARLEKLITERVGAHGQQSVPDDYHSMAAPERDEEVSVPYAAALRLEDLEPPAKAPGGKGKGAREYLQSLLYSRSDPKPRSTRQPMLRAAAEPPTSPPERLWTHLEVQPGLELNIENGYEKPANKTELDELIRQLREALERYFKIRR